MTWPGAIGRGLLIMVVTTVLTLTAWTVVPLLWGWQAYTVTSGSMSPLVRPGDVVIASPHVGSGPRIGQVVVIGPATPGGEPVTHRVVEQLPDGRYRTRGDANAQPDSRLVAKDQLIGVGHVVVPLAGLVRLHGGPIAPTLAGLALVTFALTRRRLPRFRGRTAVQPQHDPAPPLSSDPGSPAEEGSADGELHTYANGESREASKHGDPAEDDPTDHGLHADGGPDHHGPDGHGPDGHGPDGHESDGHESDGHESDGHESDGHESDGHESDGHESDCYKSDDQDSDGPGPDGYKSDDQESDDQESDGSGPDGSESYEDGTGRAGTRQGGTVLGGTVLGGTVLGGLPAAVGAGTASRNGALTTTGPRGRTPIRVGRAGRRRVTVAIAVVLIVATVAGISRPGTAALYTATTPTQPNAWKSTYFYQAAIKATVPVAYWRMGGTSTTLAPDEMGGAALTLYGAPTAGAVGAVSVDPDTALKFKNGSARSYAAIPGASNTALSIAGPMSVAAWTDGTANTNWRLVFKGKPDASKLNYLLSWSSDSGVDMRFLVDAAGTRQEARSKWPTDGKYHFVVGVYDGSFIRLYIDGVQTASKAATGALASDPTIPLTVSEDNASTGLNGSVDEVAIWNKALTADQVSKFYALGRQ
ncbi:signal peptidase I [Actinoplanes sp. NPDC051494]|uniref:signal peptidase I n=1 Tax=Actinoplanes sp. NPDC051494 TaxID=3363907 RepID=UPI0037A439E5